MRLSYDHRIKEAVALSKDPKLFEKFGVNPSTARNWIYKGTGIPVLSISDQDSPKLKIKLKKLRLENRKLKALLKLYDEVKQVLPIDLQNKHIKDEDKRQEVIDAVQKSAKVSGLCNSLSMIGISRSRYERWRVKKTICPTSVSSSCHRFQPNQLTIQEVKTMKELYMSKKHLHMSVRSLQIYAKRHQIVHCSADTWYKYARKFSWKRQRRVTIQKPANSLIQKAKYLGNMIHVDISYIKLTSGTTCYLQAVLDHKSRFILAWRLTTKILGKNTAELINKALSKIDELYCKPKHIILVSDGGRENINHHVKNVLNNQPTGNVSQRVSKYHYRFSNNMIECWFRSLKNNYLDHYPSKDFHQLERRIRFFVHQHNNIVPLKSIDGAIPIEIITNTWSLETKEMSSEKTKEVQKVRIKDNRNSRCIGCIYLAYSKGSIST